MVFCKNKKLLLIFLFALLFVLLLASDSFASSYDVPNYNNLVKDYEYYFILNFDNGNSSRFLLFYFNDFSTFSTLYYSNSLYLRVSGTYNLNECYYNSGNSDIKWLDTKNYINSLSSYNLSQGNYTIISSNFDIIDPDGNVIHEADFKLPSITTSLEDLQTLNFDTLSISANDYYKDDIYLLVYDYTKAKETADITEIYPKKEILLNTKSKYFIKEISVGNSIYFIPIEDLGVTYKVRRQICI